MNIVVNGENVDAPEGYTVAALMEDRQLTNVGTAVAVDAVVVPASRWDATVLVAGAEVDILTAVQGG